MAFINYCNALLKRQKDACFVSDIDSFEILYLNPAMEQLLGERENILGMKFNDVIKNEKPIIDDSFVFDWNSSNIFEHKVTDTSLNQTFNVYHIKITLNDKSYILIKYEPIDYELSECTNNFETSMSRCISALQKEGDEKTKALLQILGEYYDADRANVYLIDKEKQKMPNMAFWKKDDSTPFRSDLTEKLNLDVLLNWFDHRNEVGIIEASRKLKSFDVNSSEANFLNTYEIDDIVISIIENEHKESIAIVCASNRNNPRSDLRLIHAITTFIEKDINQNDLKYTVQQINEIDMLTGFFSRVAYSQKIDELQSNPPKSLGLVFTNINGLKNINSEFGYAKGDSYIKQSATYLQDHFKNNFYRISGDEFIAFLYDIDKEDFESQVSCLLDQMKSDENTSFALGYAYADGRVNIDNLIKEADTAMYINKQEYYHTSDRSFSDINDTTLSDLLQYLANEEFMIYLQPQIKLSDSSLYGAEALIRRYDKTNQKMVFPDQFISLYEKKSVIRHVDIFVLEQVCKLLVEWDKKNTAIPISVNLSRVTLQEYGIVDTIAKICDKYKVPRHLLVIEVTERVGLIENNVASSLIKDFKDRGFKISLDDFGCAYSNIVTLAQIEVDEVKIDKSLVDDLTTSKKNYVLVKNVLAMCNELEGTSTLAEGIEDKEQADALKELGCHLAQGYFYSRPIPVDEFCEKYI